MEQRRDLIEIALFLAVVVADALGMVPLPQTVWGSVACCSESCFCWADAT